MNKMSRLGEYSRKILHACSLSPQNPYDYFGSQMRRSWAYGYFERLERAGLIERCDPPYGRRGHHWYKTVDETSV